MFDETTVDFIAFKASFAFEASLDVSQKELETVCESCSNNLILDFDDGIVFCCQCGPSYRIRPNTAEPTKPPYEDDNDEI